MARVEVSLNGHPYGVACEDGQEARLREIAAFCDAKMKALGAGKQTASEVQLLVLTMLTMADQMFDMKSELAKVKSGTAMVDTALEEKVASAIETLAKRVSQVAKKLATAG
jgi:cell division protein ZapA